MTRRRRIVVPHRVTQRGTRRKPTSFKASDREIYSPLRGAPFALTGLPAPVGLKNLGCEAWDRVYSAGRGRGGRSRDSISSGVFFNEISCRGRRRHIVGGRLRVWRAAQSRQAQGIRKSRDCEGRILSARGGF